ncbi:DUF559 domain-containing protein [Agromyces intestinalis]|uniref:DUF559 domain-containing protein n=1 Tax=Agromyces intestinalis TaxID=2592652 RepID=A0A5C1YE63_9MICO|nr:type IV toxin-antitoxin system AbiEi family antitoxin domain-containing protein [Agromyces intestinalis]QEO13309.1 DUF559 domain-containing protein [Agromyces intestinalis]
MPVEPHLVHQACADLGGVVSARELDSFGIDRRSLARAVRTGDLVRIRPGTYVTPEAEPDLVTALLHGGAVGCVSRLRLAGVWVLGAHPETHVAMRPTGRRRPHPACRCVQHWNDVSSSAGLVSIVDALRQVLGCLGAEEFFVCLESAMRRRLIDRRGLDRLSSGLPAEHRWLTEFARWNADSGLESLLRLRLRRYGIDVQSQVEVPGVGRVDFVVGDRLILEVDGRSNHESPQHRHKDLRRDALAAALGFETLRFDYALVVHEWGIVEAAILARVDRGLHLSRGLGRL